MRKIDNSRGRRHARRWPRAASAQQQLRPAPARAATPAAPEAQPAAPAIQSVNIVDIKELPEATQTQVNQVIAQRGDADLQKLRSSIDATPKIKSALEAKGLTSAQVIAASMEQQWRADADHQEGELTTAARRAGIRPAAAASRQGTFGRAGSRFDSCWRSKRRLRKRLSQEPAMTTYCPTPDGCMPLRRSRVSRGDRCLTPR